MVKKNEARSALLKLEQQNGQRQEDDDPDEGGDEALVDGWLGDGPATSEHRPEWLGALGERQEEADHPQARVHALDRPDYAAEHDDRQEGAHGHVRGAALVLAGARHHETCGANVVC